MSKTSTILADEAAQFLADNPTVTNIDTMVAGISVRVKGEDDCRLAMCTMQ
jgi:hypothetical protein